MAEGVLVGVKRLYLQGQDDQPTGTFTFDVNCDGEVHRWSAEVFPENGTFAGGKAMTVAIGFSCSILFCTDAFVEQAVQLKGGGKTDGVAR